MPHYETSIAAARKSMGYINNTKLENIFQQHTCVIMQLFIRSTLEYAAIIWSPSYAKYILIFERFGYYPLKNIPTNCLLEEVSVVRLETKTYIAMASFMHKLLNNSIDCPEMLHKILFYVLGKAIRARELFSCYG